MTGDGLFQALEQVPGMSRIVWHTSKAEQGDPSSRGRPGRAKKPMEFELIMNRHSKDTKLPYIVTWRILRAVLKGKELMPEAVERHMNKSLGRYTVAGAPRR